MSNDEGRVKEKKPKSSVSPNSRAVARVYHLLSRATASSLTHAAASDSLLLLRIPRWRNGRVSAMWTRSATGPTTVLLCLGMFIDNSRQQQPCSVMLTDQTSFENVCERV